MKVPKISLSFLAAFLSAWVVSCSPYEEAAPPAPPTDVAENRGAAGEELPGEGELKEDDQAVTDQGDQLKEQDRISENVEDPAPPAPAEQKNAIPVARKVPGRPGFVFSPFNNKMINVQGFASGTMVADPTYPPAEKKYFRVP